MNRDALLARVGAGGRPLVEQIANGNFDLPLMFAALVILSTIGVLPFMTPTVGLRRSRETKRPLLSGTVYAHA